MAVQFGYPIVPMSIVGAFEFSRKGDWKLFPSKIVVHLHEQIETTGLGKEAIEALRSRVQAIVSRPVDAYYGSAEQGPPPSKVITHGEEGREVGRAHKQSTSERKR